MAYFKYQNKNIYYEEIGSGLPVMLLHGDAASSRMFELLLPLYRNSFKVILIDFLGNGRSDRIEKIPTDLWISEAQQVIALLEHLHYDDVSLIGTSGGAWAAINAALARPDLIGKVVADSFDGRSLADDFSKNLLEERVAAKEDVFSRQFYQWCQGEDWESVVDLNTAALLACAQSKHPLFQKPIETLKIPVLFVGSMQDQMCRRDMQEEYTQMTELVPEGEMYFFPTGEHPAMLSNAEEFLKIVEKFLRK